MASRLRRRVASVFPAYGTAAGTNTGSAVGTTRNLPPVWVTPSGAVIPATFTMYRNSGSWGAYQFLATDPEGATVSYAVTPGWTLGPGWILSSNGQLQIPPSTVAGPYYNSIDASDGFTATSLSYWITVANNTAPAWTTAASFSITRGTTSYQLVATDPDAQTLTYALQGGSTLPSGWALSSSGLLTLPANAAVQIYPSFTVLVSDGITTTARTFTVTVTAGSAGSVSLAWTAPTTNTSGQTFNGSTADRTLAGYRIYYGMSNTEVITSTVGAMVGSAQMTSTAATSVVIGGLLPGTWYFDVRAYDGNGDESQGSDAIAVVVT